MNPQPEKVKKAEVNGSTYSVIFSNDEGETWSEPQSICRKDGCYYVHNDRILQLSDGRIIIPANFVPEESYGNGIETSDNHGCFYSDDNGKTWKESNWISAQNEGDHLAESIAVELPDGRVKAFMRSTSGYMRQSISKDRGETWEPEYATALRMPCSPFTVKKDPHTGHYFAVWINSFPAPFPAPTCLYPRSPLSLAVSQDNTESWKFLFDIECNPYHAYGYPALHIAKDHLIMTYCVDTRGRSFHPPHRGKLKVFDREEVYAKL
jgi:sialidase-1